MWDCFLSSLGRVRLQIQRLWFWIHALSVFWSKRFPSPLSISSGEFARFLRRMGWYSLCYLATTSGTLPCHISLLKQCLNRHKTKTNFIRHTNLAMHLLYHANKPTCIYHIIIHDKILTFHQQWGYFCQLHCQNLHRHYINKGHNS